LRLRIPLSGVAFFNHDRRILPQRGQPALSDTSEPSSQTIKVSGQKLHSQLGCGGPSGPVSDRMRGLTAKGWPTCSKAESRRFPSDNIVAGREVGAHIDEREKWHEKFQSMPLARANLRVRARLFRNASVTKRHHPHHPPQTASIATYDSPAPRQNPSHLAQKIRSFRVFSFRSLSLPIQLLQANSPLPTSHRVNVPNSINCPSPLRLPPNSASKSSLSYSAAPSAPRNRRANI